MQGVWLQVLFASVFGLLAWCSTAAAVDAGALARQGNGRGAVACQSCHGADGAGQRNSDFPRLAGLDAAYLRKQLGDFASGTRENPVMTPIAKALGAGERQALADYYSKLPVPALPTKPTAARPADNVGARLATRGRWADQLPGCEQCHGPGGVGVGAHFPPLVGQPASYIEAQLKAWKQGSRHNDPLDLMKHLSGALSDADIAAVAGWFAAQPLQQPEASHE
jgi:cytochrome c553